MIKKLKTLIFLGLLILFFILIASAVWYLSRQNIMVMNPKGIIATKQKNLIFTVVGLMMIVVIPVFIMAAWFPYKYRESSKRADYKPNWDNNNKLEAIWWGVPILIISVIATVTWISTYDLDPFKPIASNKQTKNIQVIAMEWKWLFIYPEEGIVSVNKVVIPKDTPISFQITADAPMNSFWIPQLAGQIYAMNGMSTKLHLEGNEVGDYAGMSANISGEGFSDMRFVASVTSDSDYQKWVDEAHGSGDFSYEQYKQLTIPSKKNVQQQFRLADSLIYQNVISKYMPMGHESHGGHSMGSM